MIHSTVFKKAHFKISLALALSVSVLLLIFIVAYNTFFFARNRAETDEFLTKSSIQIERYINFTQTEKFKELRKEGFFPEQSFTGPGPRYNQNYEKKNLIQNKTSHKFRRSPPFLRDFYSAYIHPDSDKNIVFHEFDESEDNENLKELADRILLENKHFSYRYGNYAYKVTECHGGYIIVILNRSGEIYQERTSSWISLFALTIIVVVVFLLSWKFSWYVLVPAEESFNAQKRFIADASHELKTPVSVIGANIDVLEQELPDNKWLSYIKTENSRMSKLVTDLLYLAKTDAGQISCKKECFNIANACACSVLPFESLAFEQGKKLELYLEEEKIFVCGDEEKIKQLIIILTDNAIKNSEKGAFIKVSCYSDSQNVFVKVYNTGHGIPEKDIPRIFDRFYRTDRSRSRETGGSGLGLSIAKSIALCYGGTLEVSSREEEYAEFTLKLPNSVKQVTC